MKLFLTIEAQSDAIESGLREILDCVNAKLSFIIQNDAEFEDNDYGTEFKSIAIIPTCVNKQYWEILGWKERKQIWRKKGEADFRLKLDYDQFMRESPENKRLLFIENIVRSLEIIQERSKSDFKGEKLIEDILEKLNVTWDQIREIREHTGNEKTGDG